MKNQLKRKNLAKTRLEKLVTKGMMPCVAKDYTDEGLVFYSDSTPFGGMLYWANDMGSMPDSVVNKIKEIEERYKVTVYHATHEFLEFGECWDLWCITDEDLEYGEEDFDKHNITMAYVMNTTIPEYSEFGSIQFRMIGGGAVRTA